MQQAVHELSPEVFEGTEARQRLAKMLMRLFDHWQLDNRAKLDLLGMSANSRARLTRFAAGTAALPKGRDTRDRAAYLLAVHKALRLLYPENPGLRYDWVNRRNQALDNLRPIDIMRDHGLIGIAKIARFLDYLRGQ